MFGIYKTESNRDLPYVPVPLKANVVPKIGLALIKTADAGTYEVCYGASNKPEYICMQEGAASANVQDVVAVRVDPDTVWETTNGASLGSVNIGDKVQIASGGLTVGNTTSNGVAEILAKPTGSATGESVLVRFN